MYKSARVICCFEALTKKNLTSRTPTHPVYDFALNLASQLGQLKAEHSEEIVEHSICDVLRHAQKRLVECTKRKTSIENLLVNLYFREADRIP